MARSGWLCIDGIRFQCLIGVSERERESVQELVVDMRVKCDFARAAASDSIREAVDYRALTRRLVAAGSASSFRLVESLVTYLAGLIIDEFPGVEEVRIELEKPGALSAASSVRAIATAQRKGAGRGPGSDALDAAGAPC